MKTVHYKDLVFGKLYTHKRYERPLTYIMTGRDRIVFLDAKKQWIESFEITEEFYDYVEPKKIWIGFPPSQIKSESPKIYESKPMMIRAWGNLYESLKCFQEVADESMP